MLRVTQNLASSTHSTYEVEPYDMNFVYKPGKDLLISDALSGANLHDATPDIHINHVNEEDSKLHVVKHNISKHATS